MGKLVHQQAGILEYDEVGMVCSGFISFHWQEFLMQRRSRSFMHSSDNDRQSNNIFRQMAECTNNQEIDHPPVVIQSTE